MSHLKINYGIDLGTTNSAICRMENGVPLIKKSDTLKDVMPSCVSMTKKKTIRIGDGAYNDMKSDKRSATKKWEKGNSNTYIEFKRTMGTDEEYYSCHMDKKYSSEELASEVLKALKSYVTDETFNAAVITVPARFNAMQVAATKRAAKMAGIEHCEILQEPIAASMAYGLYSQQENGCWMVFDFGGGTFDAALLKVEDGIKQVFDTAGDNYLGGKNLDEAIVNDIILPYLKHNYSIDGILADKDKRGILREAMKIYAEEAKIALSFKSKEDIISNIGDLGNDEDGVEIELDLTVTQDELFATMRPLFQKAINICKDLLQRNGLHGEQLSKLILVGGPTYSPLIRQMLKEQITPNIDISIDPMTAVACGAALYASTIDNDVKEEQVAGTVILEVGYEATSVEVAEWISIKLNSKDCKWGCPEKVWVELVCNDKAWSSSKIGIDAIGNVIEVNLKEGKPNVFIINAYNDDGALLPCFPNEITIIQGSKVGSAVLPYNIGIEIWDNDKEKAVFRTIPGLEMNKTYPAVGVKNGLKTTQQLRPGIESDRIKIPLYQAGNPNDDGKSASLFVHIDDVVITGLELESLVSQNSDVDLTIKAVKDGFYNIDVYFPSLDYTVTKPLEVNNVQKSVSDSYLSNEMSKTRHLLTKMKGEGCDTDKLEKQLNDVRKELENGSQTQQVLENLRKVLRSIEDLESNSEWERLERTLRRQFGELEKDQKKYGNVESGKAVEQLKNVVDQAIHTKNVKIGKEVLEQIRAMDYKLALIEYFIVWICNWNQNFSMTSWKDINRARQLVSQGMNIINDSPTTVKLKPIVGQLISLLPDSELPEGASALLTER